MRIVGVPCLTLGASLILSGADCDAVIEVVREKKNGQMAVRNTSDKPLIAYVLASGTKSKDGSPIRTFFGVFRGQDSLAPGESIEIGKAEPESTKLFVDYVRFVDGWRCGNVATPEGKRVAARFAK